MIVDILMAFVFAMIVEMGSFIYNGFKTAIVYVMCATLIFTYFINGYQINFAGEMDLAVWIVFVIIFDETLMLATNKLKKYIKDNF